MNKVLDDYYEMRNFTSIYCYENWNLKRKQKK